MFVLENHVYRTAGHQHWSEQVKTQGMDERGISLNKALFAKAFSSHGKDFVVYDKKMSRIFILENKTLATSVYGKEKKGEKQLVVLPVEAFQEEDDVSKIPGKLQ